MKKIILQKGNVRKVAPTALYPRADTGGQMKKLTTTVPSATSYMKDEFTSLKEAALAVQRIRLSAQRELELARKMRADAQRYQQETATRARSEAQQLILRTRLTTQREIEELIRQASEEIQKVLADIRVIRITAQEELAAQRKFTDAAKICAMSLSIKGNYQKPEGKRKKQLTAAK
ncbi:MAG TPA: hypothetical protein VMW86_06415 [Dehalococcoidales bacterium]|nr:hypothetical protein [Dehalococcoidales bacterium]